MKKIKLIKLFSSMAWGGVIQEEFQFPSDSIDCSNPQIATPASEALAKKLKNFMKEIISLVVNDKLKTLCEANKPYSGYTDEEKRLIKKVDHD